MQLGTAGQLKESSQRKPGATKAGNGSRTRPTNNQLLYRATFQWDHYRRSLYGNPKLPSATEACASVTSAFLQVIGVLFEVERIRNEQPRNILRLLSTNTRRTKVVELSSGTHRVPDELKRHSIGDGEGGQYSTNLDRNRYGSDDQYLATVIRYNLESLELCPCLVNVTILEAKGGDVAVVVSAGASACQCRSNGGRPVPDARQRTIRTVGGRSLDPEEQKQLREGVLPREGTPDSPSAHSEDQGKAAEKRVEPAAPSKSNGGSELFDALLAAAAEPPVTSRRKNAKALMIPRSPRHDGQSSQDSEVKDEQSPKATFEEPLRRSRRKSVKLFNAVALEREAPAESEDDLSAHSVEGDAETTLNRRRGSFDDWEREVQPLRSRRSAPVRGASAASLSKLSGHLHGRDLRRLQQENQRLHDKLEELQLALEESRSQEASARYQVKQLQQELAQKAGHKGAQDAKATLFKNAAGLSKAPPESSEQALAVSLLKEAQDRIAALEKDKASLCAAVSSAGLPVPQPPPDIPTPHRNGEHPLNGFHAQPQLRALVSSAFSIPFPASGFPAFQQYQRPLMPITPGALQPLMSTPPPDGSPNLGNLALLASSQMMSPPAAKHFLRPLTQQPREAEPHIVEASSGKRSSAPAESASGRAEEGPPLKRGFEGPVGKECKELVPEKKFRAGE